MSDSQPIGVLLINLGTPEAPTPSALRTYLREFLSDPRVIDINPVGRWLLLNLIILPFRPARSAEAYRQIWTDDGSPLLLHGVALRDALAERLGDGYVVALGMRYGNPSLHAAARELMSKDVSRVVALPLFPQYSSAASGSAAEACMEVFAGKNSIPELEVLGSFSEDPGFIAAFEAVHREVLDDFEYDHLLFSYHGLPERHVVQSESGPIACDRREPCPALSRSNRYCYRAQCYASSRLLAAALGIDDDTWSVAFQSRLGREPWIRPYTDHVLPDLYDRGVRRLAVACPSFVADCLETLEEIAIRGAEQWKGLGGETFAMVPSLNTHPRWVDAVADLVTR